MFQNICRIPGIIQLLVELGNSYNMQAVLSLLLKQMIPRAVVECIGNEPLHYFTLLSGLLQTVDLDSTLVSTIVRCVDVLYAIIIIIIIIIIV